MKRILVLFVASIIVILGCGKKHIQPWRVAQQYAETVIDCAKQRDSEGIKELFCTNVQEAYDLDEEIEEFFGFIDGNITSYDEPEGQGSGMTSDWDGVIEQEIMGNIWNVKTDKGKTYIINVYGYVENRNHKDYIGVTSINIKDTDLYDEKKGDFPDEAVVSIGGIEEPVKSILPDDF